MTLGIFLGYATLVLIFTSITSAIYLLGANRPVEPPQFGRRGLKRQEALNGEGLFPTIEPIMRLAASWFANLRAPVLREKIARRILHSGDYLGLSPDEFLGLSLVSGVGGFALGLGSVKLLDMPTALAIAGLFLGTSLPWFRLESTMKVRFKSVNRSLPGMIDLAAMCMSAGLDFPGALRQISASASSRDRDLVEEFSRILQELDLGHTRRKALENFADRVPTEAVRDFVSTVVQAEQKGTPLGEVLSIQARMLRMRRSVAAEEAAAKAGLLMMGPLMLIFICVIMLLMGPFAVRWMTSGL